MHNTRAKTFYENIYMYKLSLNKYTFKKKCWSIWSRTMQPGRNFKIAVHVKFHSAPPVYRVLLRADRNLQQKLKQPRFIQGLVISYVRSWYLKISDTVSNQSIQTRIEDSWQIDFRSITSSEHFDKSESMFKRTNLITYREFWGNRIKAYMDCVFELCWVGDFRLFLPIYSRT